MATTVLASLETTIAKKPGQVAALSRTAAGFVPKTWSELGYDRETFGAGLLDLGHKPGERVALLAKTSYAWLVSDLGIASIGGSTVSIYPTSTADEVGYILADSGATIAVVENFAQLEKVLAGKTERLRRIVVLDGEVSESALVVSAARLGGRARVGEVKALASKVTPDRELCLIYTSGTTGRPKGVVLTHGNLAYEAAALERIPDMARPDDVGFLFLPLAHSFARVLEAAWLRTGHTMAVDGDFDRVLENFKLVRPTVCASVPRVFEKIYAKVVERGLAAGGLRARLFRLALEVAERAGAYADRGEALPLGLRLQLGFVERRVFSEIGARLREGFGGRLRYFVSGGAPLSRKIARFFAHAGVTILEGYGLTETSAATTVNPPGKNKIGTVGPPVPGTELSLAADGEILIRGPGVMRGYWNRPNDTRDVLGPDGWFRTGDIGAIDADGYLRITDRKKDLLITSGGKNVAPQNLEGRLKAQDPIFSQVVVHGDRRKYLVVLATLDPDLVAELAGDGGTHAERLAHDAVKDRVRRAIEAVNAGLSSYEQLKDFRLVAEEFEVGVELTPTMKVRRKVVAEKHKALLDEMYAEVFDD